MTNVTALTPAEAGLVLPKFGDRWFDVVRLVGDLSVDLRSDIAAAVDELLLGAPGQREQSETRLQLALGGLRGWAWEWDLKNDVHWQSPGWEKVLGYGEGEVVAGCDVLDSLVHADDKTRVRRQLIDHLLGRTPRYESEHRLATKDGRWLWMLDRGRIVDYDHQHRPLRMTGVRLDVTDRKLAEKQLRQSEQRLKTVLDSLDEGVIAVSPDLTTNLVSRAAARILNDAASANSPVSAAHLDRYDMLGEDGLVLAETMRPVVRVLRGERFSELPLRLRCRTTGRQLHLVFNGTPVFEGGRLLLGVIAFRDITEKVQAEQRAVWASSHDNLTSLPNREQFMQHLGHVIATRGSDPGKGALLVFDLDGFGNFNDARGHHVGDELLRRIGQRIRRSTRTGDFVARLGSDEFAILLPAIASAHDIDAAAARTMDEIRRPLQIDNRTYEMRASAGTAEFPGDGTAVLDLMKSADLALHAAQAAGGNRIVSYRPHMRRDLERRTRNLTLARHALAKDLIRPFYQPKIDLRSGQVIGFEALARRIDNRQTARLPRGFADALEDPDFAAAMGARIQKAALDDIAQWLDQGLMFGHVAINASPAELRDPTYAACLLDELQMRNISPHLVEVELTENVLLGDSGAPAKAIVTELASGGVRVALDDFGTGYASLSHLKALPIGVLKIDKSFVNGIGGTSGDEAIASAIIALGRSLGIQVVAEGIETADQAIALCLRGCDVGQGYWFSKPLPPADVVSYLRSYRPTPLKRSRSGA